MERLLNSVIIVLPIALLLVAVWLLFQAYADLRHRQVPNRMWWVLIIFACPIIGPAYYLLTFRGKL
jgi:Flp pilus assembly protein protease CpaA